MKISLCVITGNESAYVVRFLDSFAKDFDELCMVVAMGNAEADDTESKAREWCSKNGKKFVCDVYRNAGWTPESIGDPVKDDDPATWPHVDDFAAARNVSWKLASGDWQFWADLDDILTPASQGLIRADAESGMADYYFFTYGIATSGQINMRERLYRLGNSHWSQPVHENCLINDESKKWAHDPRVVYSHEPDTQKQRDPERNRRIAEYHLRYLNAFAPEIEREYFWKYQSSKKTEDRENAVKWAEIAQYCHVLPEQKLALLLNQAEIAAERDLEHALDLVWSAARIQPTSREPWGMMAEYELKLGRYGRADVASTLMQMMKAPLPSGMPLSRRFHESAGFYLKTRCMRAAGRGALADKGEAEMFAKHGSKISLLHATRGRPAKALETRANFLRAAVDCFAVEHIFAIDADDTESIEALRFYRHAIVDEPRGCVKAWNAAAAVSTGHILMQLSDDWVPCMHYDELLWLLAKEVAEKRGGTVANTPLVFAVGDGHRTDALLCMAILTRARYIAQFDQWDNEGRLQPPERKGTCRGNAYLFAPDYFGVFSDNEFTHRAYDDGVVIQAQHLVFMHQHPVFEGKPFAEWDATHQRQNSPDRYREGLEIFNRRNPKHAIK